MASGQGALRWPIVPWRAWGTFLIVFRREALGSRNEVVQLVIEPVIASVGLLLAAIPACLFWRNLRHYCPPPVVDQSVVGREPQVSLLIPARNEAPGIAATLDAALASRGVQLEIVVLDDHSEDATAKIVGAMAARDGRVRLVEAPLLPDDWCGKQHACWVLAQEARHPILVFLDADVRLTED